MTQALLPLPAAQLLPAGVPRPASGLAITPGFLVPRRGGDHTARPRLRWITVIVVAVVAALVAVPMVPLDVSVSPSAAQPIATAPVEAADWTSQGLAVTVTEAEAAIAAVDGTWRVGLQPVSFGWAGTEAAVGTAERVSGSDDQHVQHFDGLDAWYVSHPRGVEQGFTIPAAPAGDGTTLHVVQRTTGGLIPVPAGDQSIDFFDIDGQRRATYDGLAVWDAAGTTLQASLEVTPEGVVIAVDAAGAVYPITIDPVIAGDPVVAVSTQELTQQRFSDASYDGFGGWVAVSGDTAAVGLPFRTTDERLYRAAPPCHISGLSGWNCAAEYEAALLEATSEWYTDGMGAGVPTGPQQGGVRIYERSGDGWSHEQLIVPPGPIENSACGLSVAIDGDTLVMGCPTAGSGTAHVYARVDGQWVHRAALAAESGDPAGFFGWAVDVSGDVITVSTWIGGPGLGSVPDGVLWVFSDEGDGDGWVLRQRLQAQVPGQPGEGPVDDRSSSGLFGVTSAISGDTIVVGANGHNALYVFRRGPDGWAIEAKLPGFSGFVDIDGEVIAVTDGGSAQILRRTGTGWVVEAEPPAGGSSIAIDGSTVVFSGGEWVAVYQHGPAGWTETSSFAPPAGPSGSLRFGGVAIDGATLMVGRSTAVNGTGGRSVIEVRTDAGDSWPVIDALEQVPAGQVRDDILIEVTTNHHGYMEHGFGQTMAIGDDLLVVGNPVPDIQGGPPFSPRISAPNEHLRSAYLYRRSGSDWALEANLTGALVPPEPDGSVSAGQVVGIGSALAIHDQTVAVAGYTGLPGAFNLTIFIYEKIDGVWSTTNLPLTVAPPSFTLQWEMAMSDNHLVVGTPGKVAIFQRESAGWQLQQEMTGGSEGFGTDVAIEGDVIAVGDPDDTTGTNSGVVYLHTMTGPDWTLAQTLTPVLPDDPEAVVRNFGQSVAMAGDMLVAGAHSRRAANAFVFQRGLAGWDLQAALSPVAPGSPTVPDPDDGVHLLGVDIAENHVVVAGIESHTSDHVVHVHHRTGDGWEVRDRLYKRRTEISNPQTCLYQRPCFGSGLATSNDTIVVGEGFYSSFYRPGLSSPAPGAPSSAVYVHTFLAAPAAVEDTVAAIVEDADAQTLDVLANDTSSDGAPMFIEFATQPDNGTVTITDDERAVTYRPDADYCNSDTGVGDTFAYGLNGASTTTVSVPVTCVDDPAVAEADDEQVTEDRAAVLDVVANDVDVDGDPIVVESVTQPPFGGTVTVAPDGSAVTFSPEPDVCTGSDHVTFTYTLNGGGSAPVNVQIVCVNDAPVAFDEQVILTEDDPPTGLAVLDNDIDVDGDPLTVAILTQPYGGTAEVAGEAIVYTPDADYCTPPPGLDSVQYTVSDGQAEDVGTVQITVLCVDDAPVAVPDLLVLTEEEGPDFFLDVLGNDTDIDGGPLAVDSVTDPAVGTASVAPDGTGIVFSAPGYCDDDVTQTIGYTLNGGSESTVDVTVRCVLARSTLLRTHAQLQDLAGDKDVDKAIEDLQSALDRPAWIDLDRVEGNDAKKVFDDLKKVVKHLEKADPSPLVDRAMGDVTEAARRLAVNSIAAAQDALADADCDSVDCDDAEKELERAVRELDRGDDEVADADLDKAVDRYRKAYDEARKAIEELAPDDD